MRTSNIILFTPLLLCFGTVALAVVTIRYRVDHHMYDSKKEAAKSEFIATPLSPFSQIVLDGYGDVTIRQGNVNSIGWTKSKQGSAAYTLSGDSLVLRDLGGGIHLDNTTITVQNLAAIHLKNASGFNMVGLKMDSLAIFANESDGDIGFDSTDLRRLHLEFGGNNTFSIRNSKVDGLWLNLKDNATLSLENARIQWIRGHWTGDINLKADSATLQHGIEKIETIQ